MDPTLIGGLFAAFTVVTNAITWFVANRGKVKVVVDDVKAIAVNDPTKPDLVEKAEELKKTLSDIGALIAVLNDHGIAVPTPLPVPAPAPTAATVHIDVAPILAEIRAAFDAFTASRATARVNP